MTELEQIEIVLGACGMPITRMSSPYKGEVLLTIKGTAGFIMHFDKNTGRFLWVYSAGTTRWIRPGVTPPTVSSFTNPLRVEVDADSPMNATLFDTVIRPISSGVGVPADMLVSNSKGIHGKEE